MISVVKPVNIFIISCSYHFVYVRWADSQQLSSIQYSQVRIWKKANNPEQQDTQEQVYTESLAPDIVYLWQFLRKDTWNPYSFYIT